MDQSKSLLGRLDTSAHAQLSWNFTTSPSLFVRVLVLNPSIRSGIFQRWLPYRRTDGSQSTVNLFDFFTYPRNSLRQPVKKGVNGKHTTIRNTYNLRKSTNVMVQAWNNQFSELRQAQSFNLSHTVQNVI